MASSQKGIRSFMTIGVLILGVCQCTSHNFSISPRHMRMQVHDFTQFNLAAWNLTLNRSSVPLTVVLIPQHEDILNIAPNSIEIIGPETTGFNYTFVVRALSAGKSEIAANSSARLPGLKNIFLIVEVYRSFLVETLSVMVGWFYFICWGGSYYPQILKNYRRKSVVGLNFDFLVFNIIGYSAYTIFNAGLFYIPSAQEEYFRRHSRSPNPISANDLVFVIHGTLASVVTGYQAYVYESKGQSVSSTGISVCKMYAGIFLLSLVLYLSKWIHFLDFLYMCSIIKLIVTVTKYVPQACMNYERQSTDGWSIGNVVLDFAGAIGSLLQMLLNAYNYNDMAVILENPTKFGLAVLTLFFGVIFMVQHFVLYNKEYDCEGKTSEEEPDEDEIIKLIVRKEFYIM